MSVACPFIAPSGAAGLAISKRGRGLFRELVTHLRSQEGGARAVSGRRGWEGRLCGGRVGERFLAGLQAGGVLDFCVVAVPEGGAPVWRGGQLPACSSGETEGIGVSHWCAVPRGRLLFRTLGIPHCN